jgi:hypothetical protein
MTDDATAIVRAQLADAPTALLLEEVARRGWVVRPLATHGHTGPRPTGVLTVSAYPVEIVPFDSELPCST